MASFSLSYRKITAACFLLFYLAGTFQGPALEGLHFLSHWRQKIQKHHFHHHGDAAAGHHHGFLDLAAGLLAPFADEPAPASDKSEPLKKKFAECVAALPWLPFPSDAALPEPEGEPFQPKVSYPSVPTPPPRV